MTFTENNRCEKDRKTILEQTAGEILAPVLNSFVVWLLQDAGKRGIRRLYFLARDGYFMYRAAEMICRKLQLPMECRYLYCSRYALRVPLYHLNMEDALSYICRGGIDVTLEKILKRSGIAGEEQREVIHRLNLPFPETQSIPYAELPDIRRKLEACSYFMTCVYRHSHMELPNLQGYLAQEDFFDDTPKALVDSGWTGSTQKDLQRLVSYFEKENNGYAAGSLLEGYYWGMYELPQDMKKESYHCYYFQPRGNLREKVYFSNCLFETIYSAPHGMTLGYTCADGRYVPIYAPYDKKQKKWMEQLERIFMDYAAQFAGGVEQIQNIDCVKERRMVRRLMGRFMGHPTVAEAELFGSLMFSDDVLEDEKQPVAARLNEAELKANHVGNKALVMLGIKRDYIKESAWYEGSAVRNGKHVSWHLLQYRAYKYLLYLRQMYWKRQ